MASERAIALMRAATRGRLVEVGEQIALSLDIKTLSLEIPAIVRNTHDPEHIKVKEFEAIVAFLERVQGALSVKNEPKPKPAA